MIACGGAAVHWLPPGVEIAEAELERTLRSEEKDYATTLKAAPRRAEYLRSRYLIRKLTGCADPLPRGPSGEPSWPDGLVGSLTHKDGWVGVTVMPRAHALSVGIDAEDEARVKPEFLPRICVEREKALVRDPATLAAVFSFKEALFKAHFPLGKTMFFFHDAEIIALDEGNGEIVARVLKTTSPRTPAGSLAHGHFLRRSEGGRSFVMSSVVVMP